MVAVVHAVEAQEVAVRAVDGQVAVAREGQVRLDEVGALVAAALVL